MFCSVQSLSHVWLFATPWMAAHQASLSITNSWSLLKLMSITSVMSSDAWDANHLILCRPLLLLPSIFPSIRVFSNESMLCIRWPKYWSFNFSISPSNEYLGLVCFRMDWLDLFAVHGTLKNLLQHNSSKASILLLLWHFFPLKSLMPFHCFLPKILSAKKSILIHTFVQFYIMYLFSLAAIKDSFVTVVEFLTVWLCCV